MWKVISQLSVDPGPEAVSAVEVQVTVPEPEAHPTDADTNVVPAGTPSATVNPALSLGPWLVAVTVNVMSSPATPLRGPDFEISMSASRLTVVCAVDVSLPLCGSEVAFV